MKSELLEELYEVIADRRENPVEDSYTNYLFTKGLDKILKKVGEESTEVIIAAKNSDNSETVYEICDLAYHIMVLMVEKGIKLEDIEAELEKRRQKIGNKKPSRRD
ncbi:phosphoribosyl-ATP diphosphatase [Clostridium oryzae]|uniref:Phosphoribosyl-ATP pyrophosphatase n=1 Tax=Clostridium oryzae TaxID=1450648 RepID=A0A1V4INQ2_9CLOT|nr:phosphoribosyl-ATP diphosphatase [Clostridium oryzae]OPJ61536.1 phosphoribosyl-ATP pyrophosphatase [Clostridium oryzae]